MLTYNIDQLSGLVNGSRGVIIGFTEMKFPIVRFKNHKRNNLAPKLNKTNEDIKSDSTFQPKLWKILKQRFLKPMTKKLTIH